jgi:hypothetical protein
MRVLQQPWFPAELKIQRADALVWGTSGIQEAWRLLVRQGPGGRVSEADSVLFGRAELERAFTALGDLLVRRGVVLCRRPGRASRQPDTAPGRRRRVGDAG